MAYQINIAQNESLKVPGFIRASFSKFSEIGQIIERGSIFLRFDSKKISESMYLICMIVSLCYSKLLVSTASIVQ